MLARMTFCCWVLVRDTEIANKCKVSKAGLNLYDCTKGIFQGYVLMKALGVGLEGKEI